MFTLKRSKSAILAATLALVVSSGYAMQQQPSFRERWLQPAEGQVGYCENLDAWINRVSLRTGAIGAAFAIARITAPACIALATGDTTIAAKDIAVTIAVAVVSPIMFSAMPALLTKLSLSLAGFIITDTLEND